MPPFPLVDSHVHLWDPANVRMTWLDGNRVLNQTYLPAEYKTHTAGIEIEGIVYLETGVVPHYAFYEAGWAAKKLAVQEPRIRAVVAAAPLEYGEGVRSYIQALKDLSPLIKGVRRITQGEGDPAFCLQDDFVRGARLLHEFGFSCDLCFTHVQLKHTIELVKRCPDTQFVIDHLAKPNIREHVLEPWRTQMKEMAALPNISCKLSGAVTEADREHWTPADLKPYLDHVIEVFGEDRVMFGGDWPVLLLASTYQRWVQALDELTLHLSAAARRKLWSENAQRFYRMK